MDKQEYDKNTKSEYSQKEMKIWFSFMFKLMKSITRFLKIWRKKIVFWSKKLACSGYCRCGRMWADGSGLAWFRDSCLIKLERPLVLRHAIQYDTEKNTSSFKASPNLLKKSFVLRVLATNRTTHKCLILYIRMCLQYFCS